MPWGSVAACLDRDGGIRAPLPRTCLFQSEISEKSLASCSQWDLKRCYGQSMLSPSSAVARSDSRLSFWACSFEFPLIMPHLTIRLRQPSRRRGLRNPSSSFSRPVDNEVQASVCPPRADR